MIKHGRNGYERKKCRCSICVEAYRTYHTSYMAEVRSGARGQERLLRLRAQTKKQNEKPKNKKNAEKMNNERRSYLYKLKEVPCADCGNRYPSCAMDFHHKPGTVKLFSVGTSMARNWEAILAEAQKCDVICANCHRIRHFNSKKQKE